MTSVEKVSSCLQKICLNSLIRCHVFFVFPFPSLLLGRNKVINCSLYTSLPMVGWWVNPSVHRNFQKEQKCCTAVVHEHCGNRLLNSVLYHWYLVSVMHVHFFSLMCFQFGYLTFCIFEYRLVFSTTQQGVVPSDMCSLLI